MNPPAVDAATRDAAGRNARSPEFLLTAALVAVVLLLYLRTATFDFINLDDATHILGNARVTGGLTPSAALWALVSTEFDLWMPVTWLSLMLDVTLFGVNPGASHLVNVLLHAGNCILLAYALRGLALDRWQRFAAVALFAVHPQHVEVVAWVIERKELLAMTFGLGSWLAFQRWRRAGGTAPYLFSLLLFLGSLAAKPMWITWPLILFALERLDAGRPHPWKRPAFRPFLPLFVLSGAIAWLTLTGAHANRSLVPLATYPLAERFEWMFAAYRHYVLSAFYPVDLATYVERWPGNLGAHAALAGALLLAFGTLGGLLARKSHPLATAGWFWFVVSLFPVSGIVQLGGHWVADRYSYYPHIGLFVMLVSLAGAARTRRRVLAWTVAVSVVTVWFAYLASAQISYWRNSETFWERAVSLAPSPYPYIHFGNYYLATGRPELAAGKYREAVRRQPGAVAYRAALAQSYLLADRQERLDGELAAIARLEPGTGPARRLLDLAGMLVTRGDFVRARPILERMLAREASERRDWYPRALLNYAILATAEGRTAIGRRALREVASRDRALLRGACTSRNARAASAVTLAALRRLCDNTASPELPRPADEP